METLKNRMPLIRQTINSIISLADPGHYSFFKRYLPDIKLDQLIEPLNDLLKTGTNITFRLIQRLFFNTAFFIAHFALVLVMVFFLFLDGKTLLEKINSLIPLKQSEGNEMIREIIRVIDATVFGTFIIGLIEGAFGGLIFFVFGIPAPVLWGIVMMIFSMIPVVGTNTIIWPAGIMQIAIGNRVTGTLMLLFGFVGITATQNLLKPKLLGDRAGLHPAFVLLSVIGGIYWLGIIGFIVGPLLTTLFLVIWNQFGIRFKHELEMRNKSDTGSST
ncbi:MAG: hypothetical protein A2096_15825 [Spirochaetes bacterium GWF1_41_5]|nr:MAG: hypothetical protein A2096_15825 [Spirochaetes bacterium GWF1_41_5]